MGKRAADNILNSFKVTLKLHREILDLPDEADDEVTKTLMDDYISEQKKLVWMFSSHAAE